MTSICPICQKEITSVDITTSVLDELLHWTCILPKGRCPCMLVKSKEALTVLTEERQGELKQRILNEINADWNDKLFCGADYEKGELVTQEQILKKVLDEAKTEYPTAKEIIAPDDENDGKGWKQVAVFMEQKTLERQRWFNKWFGAP